MAVVLPAIKGKMGSIEYYDTVMKARELVSQVRIASERDDWADSGIEERMQREVHTKRVSEEIVPYLRKSPDRFTGSVIVLVLEPEIFTFEPVQDLGSKIPAAYRGVAEKLGFVTIVGGEFIYLDGQHRGAAYREIIQSSKSVLGATDGNTTNEVANDDVCVIFVQYENNEKTRRIFNKVNRYARSTSRADNIITSEDDGYAIVCRKLFAEGAPLHVFHVHKTKNNKELVINFKSNTISERSIYFTTTSAVYEIVKEILNQAGIRNFDEKSRVVRPSDDEINEALEIAEDWWTAVLSGIEAYKETIYSADTEGVIDASKIIEMRKSSESTSLLFKPAGQIALFRGLIKAVQNGIDRSVAINRLNEIDWSPHSDIWDGTIVHGNKMSTKREDYEIASELISYLIGSERMDAASVSALQKAYHEARNGKILPGESVELEELPEPVVS